MLYEVITMFDTCLRVLFPVKWQGKDKGNFYQFDANKQASVLEKLGITKDCTDFEEFSQVLYGYWLEHSQEAKGQELTDQQVHDNAAKRLPKQLQAAYEDGLTITEMELLFKEFLTKNGLIAKAKEAGLTV